MTIPGLSNSGEMTFRFLAWIFGVLRKIPLVDEAIDHAHRRILNPVVVKLIRNVRDPDLDAALKLYQERIPDDQRFEASDIIRWLREDGIRRKQTLTNTGPTDWFLVAKYRRRVCGFILFHYYPSARLAMFAYMVVGKGPGIPVNSVSSSLCSAVSRLLETRRELRNSVGFALEVEDPRKEKNAKKRAECLARIRRFCSLAEMQGFSLRAFDINYKQPRLSLEHGTTERPMLLLSARTREGPLKAAVQRAEAEEVLSFIYTSVYPEGYSTDAEENQSYLEYCRSLCDRELAALPKEIHSLSSSQLVAQVRSKKQNSALAVARAPYSVRAKHPDQP